MKLAQLVKPHYRVKGSLDIDIKGIAYDSRQVKEGFVFFAISGQRVDGATFISDAIKRGAIAVVISTNHARDFDFTASVTWVITDDVRDTLAYMANVFYEEPSSKLDVIAVTGTNGKTSTTYITQAILQSAGYKTGIIGTIRYIIGEKAVDAPHTTPEAPDFQAILSEMLSSGCRYCVSEVSSHALAQKRVDYTRFPYAIFTNLTQDHLDYHKSMTEYFLAKQRLFTELLDGTAVINIDDEYGCRLVDTLRAKGTKILTYAISNPDADIIASDIEYSFKGTRFNVSISGSKNEFKTELVGITAVYNILASIAVTTAMQIPIKSIKEGVRMVNEVTGRFQKVDLGQDFLAVVDYAHTADALEKLILTARQLLNAFKVADETDKMVKQKQWHLTGTISEANKTGKVITVFGCGGDRDKSKRAKMGEVASKHSDFVIITSDNPRSEDPRGIIKDIEKGIKGDNYVVIPDRNVAIALAVELASDGDIVLVAGKGHEQYQEIKDQKYSFSDKVALENAIKRTISRQNTLKSYKKAIVSVC